MWDFQSLTSAITKTVSSTVESVKETWDKEKEEFQRDEQKYNKGFSTTSGEDLPIWEKIPEKWQGDRANEWRALAQLLPKDHNTFLIGAERELGEFEASCCKECGIAIDFAEYEKVDETKTSSCAVASLSSCKQLDDARFALVPKKVKDGIFWKRFFWKCGELSNCENSEKVLTMLCVLNTASIADEDQKAKRVGELKEILAEYLEIEGRRNWMKDNLERLTEETKTAQEASQLLTHYMEKCSSGGVDEKDKDLMESLFESCKYHKQKISSMLGEITTKLDDTTGNATVEGLMKENEELQNVIKAYSSKFEGKGAVQESTPAAAEGGDAKGMQHSAAIQSLCRGRQ
eukprot:TRINITY_DN68016_c2_g3_i2.p1 TRINITY_DN68016_c2_g3~~TRINITY_DN68016_c2_g3_i2.p1  ORF type:complete len:355 (-),score=41.56 TRINITY_DN68016_c2_g3_i2:1163-2200(-)